MSGNNRDDEISGAGQSGPVAPADGVGQGSPSFAGKIFAFLKQYVLTFRTYILAACAFVAKIYGWFDSLTTKVMPIYDRYTYIQTLEKPFPTIIDQSTIDAMSSGEAELALMRIDGYLGRLKDDKTWKKLCVTEAASEISKTPDDFLNTKYLLAESRIDQINRSALEKRIEQIEITKVEDAGFQRKSNVFDRLLGRSSKQLLYRYKSQEIDLLDKPQLYLLRNAIYGRHGYIFSTAKLHKFTNRHGWKALKQSPEAPNSVETCNANFLDELHPARELGAVGRGVLFSQDAAVPATFKAEVCACLGRPKYGIECRDDDGSSRDQQFYDFVDLVIDVREGDTPEVKWTYLDPSSIADASLPQFQESAGRFHAAALQFSAELQDALAPAGVTVTMSPEEGLRAYWGTTITLPDKFLSRMRIDPKLTYETSNLVCQATYNAIDQTGSSIPWTIGTEPEMVDVSSLRIFSKPVVFDDDRLALTREYLARAYPSSNANVVLRPRAIVLQATAADDIDAVFQQMLPAAKVGASQQRELNPATHYLVGAQGTVYRLMNDAIVSRHAPGLEMNAIGIGLVGALQGPPRDGQVGAARSLIKYLKATYPTIDYVIPTDSVLRFSNTDLWTGPVPPIDKPRSAPGELITRTIISDLGQIGLRSKP